MNLRLITINIENFRSIEKAYIELENQGTVIVKGINEYEDKATSNGSGKSSIFEAIVYALFEETSAGEKSVSNRITNKGYKLILNFSIDSDTYILTRQQQGSKSSVELIKNNVDISARNKTDTNKLILSILGINKDIFLDSVFLSQNANTNLATLSPTARKERLEILTSTDYTINSFKDKLKDKQLEYENNKLTAKLEVEKLNGTQQAIINQKQDLENKINQIKLEINKLKELGTVEELDNQIKVFEDEIVEYDDMILNEKNNIKEIELKIDSSIKDSEQYLVMSKELNIDILAKKDEIGQLESELNLVQGNNVNNTHLINMYNNEINNIKNSDKCPTCGRKLDGIDDSHIEKTINEKTTLINKLQESITNNNIQIQDIDKNINIKIEEGKAIRNKLNEVEAKLNEYKNIEYENRQQINIINGNINKLQLEKDKCSKNIIQLNQKKLELAKVINNNIAEYESMIEKLDVDYAETQIAIDLHQKSYDDNNQYVDVIKNSLQLVVKEFRTYLLKNSIEYLNKLLEMYSRELFSNTIDTIKILEDDAKLDIKLGEATYESLSGGEKTRVNIALLLAQKSLANTLGNISCNLIILDEVLGYCDSEAETTVIDLINKELENLESIYMISHKEIPVAYDTVLTVVKNINGISSVE